MSAIRTPTPGPFRRSWASPRRRLLLLVLAVVIIAGVVIGVIDPFGGSPSTSSTTNADRTATASVTRQNLTSQTQVSGTLGYAGSYTVDLPAGTTASTLTQDRQTVQGDEQKVSADETALASAKALAAPTNANTLSSAAATVKTDTTALAEAKAQLAADEQLSCPASSSDTVNTAVSGGSSGGDAAAPAGSDSSGNTSSPSSSTGGTSSSSNPSSSTGGTSSSSGNAGSSKAHLAADVIANDTGTTGAPSATTGSNDNTTNTSSELTGSVNPDGAFTTYYFEYGTSPNYGENTPTSSAGSGTSDVSVAASLSGLTAGATYYFRLVAQNSYGPDYGQAATFSTNAAPSATTGAVDNTTNTSATVTGSVNPGGSDTSYYFQYGTSPNYGETTTVTDAGSGASDVSVSASLTALTPDATYYYRLVARNAIGTDYGQSSTYMTNAGPIATTGTASSASATSESLSGTVNPNGADTTYYFAWGTSAALGNKTAVTDAGAGTTATSVSATITGLTPGKTYDFALIAANALGTSTGITTTFQAPASSCVAERQVITEDSQALTQAKNDLKIDQLGTGSSVASADQALSADKVTLASAQQALSDDEEQTTNAATTFTALPNIGAVITRGKPVYSLDAQPIPLFYGATTLYRALYPGVSDGPDVAELNANLAALGFGTSATSDAFTAMTESAVTAWQSSIGVSATGVVALGDVVVEPGPIEVDTVTPTTGAAASAGTVVLTATSTSPVVTIDLDASLQSDVKVGDQVLITLPDNSTTTGVISSVSDVATAPASGSDSSSSAGSSSTPTVAVLATLSNPKAAGNLNQAPVEVSITSESVSDVLAVPVDALLALAGGGYAVETASGDHLVPVTLGLFDDAAGLVQASGTGLSSGERIVVPNL